MLQKLENIYLGILRGVVLIISGGLLLGAIIFGMNALKLVSGPPSFGPFAPSIGAEPTYKQTLIEQYQPKEETNGQPASTTPPAGTATSVQEQPPKDPLYPKYEEVADIVDTFVTEVTGETGWVNLENVIRHVESRANSYSAYRYTQAYANDIGPYVRNVLEDQNIIELANEQNVFDIVNNVLDNFNQEFEQAISAEERRRNQAHQQHAQGKIEGMQSLYIAGGTFGAFLLIVFLSIFIKIERNLRHLADLPVERHSTS